MEKIYRVKRVLVSYADVYAESEAEALAAVEGSDAYDEEFAEWEKAPEYEV